MNSPKLTLNKITNILLKTKAYIIKKFPKSIWIMRYILLPFIWYIIYAFVQMLWLWPKLSCNIIALGITGFCLYRMLTKIQVQPNKSKLTKKPLNRLLIILAIYVGLIILNLIVGSLMAVNRQGSANQAAVESLFKYSKFKMIVLAILIGPIFEENIFRRLIIKFNGKSRFKILTSKVIFYVTFGLSIIIFALAHMEQTPLNDYYTLLSYCMPGFCFALCYSITKRISDSIILHMLYNLTAALPLLTGLIILFK